MRHNVHFLKLKKPKIKTCLLGVHVKIGGTSLVLWDLGWESGWIEKTSQCR
jgi:hypothetical protein